MWTLSAPARADRSAQTRPAVIPAPTDQAADVLVSGRTSRAKHIDVAAVGRQIPPLHTGKPVHNTQGFAWYVSRHFALKTDYKPDKAAFYLRLIELAWPHYVHLFGAEPKGLGRKRLAVVYASSKAQLARALADDGIQWNFAGGGITFEDCRVAYCYPSGTLQYHQRYILLHEVVHLVQMALSGSTYNTPQWFFEGLADSFASHVWDSAAGRLTVCVLDKATTANHFDQGLQEYRREPQRFSQLHARRTVSRGMGFLMVNFFLTDPARWDLLGRYRDEMFRRNVRGRKAADVSARVLPKLYGGWDKLDADFRAWLGRRQQTFHYAEWGWEQDAGTLWSYGFAPGGNFSRTDVFLPPGQTRRGDPLRMDYPRQPRPSWLGTVRRGGAEPAVAAVIDFSRCPNSGAAGIGLGLIDRTAPAQPLPPTMLFADRAVHTPGVNVAVFEKGLLIDGGRKSEQVTNGRRLAGGIQSRVALGAPGTPTAGLKTDFVVEWDGWLKLDDPRTLEFVLASDDGSWLWINDKPVIEHGGLHAMATRTGRVTLTPGVHKLRLRYFQDRGEAGLSLGLAPPPSEAPGYLRVLIRGERDLLLDGRDLGLTQRTVALPAAFRQALPAAGHRIGLHARIAADALVVALRTQPPSPDWAPAAKLSARLPLTAAARTRLLDRPLTILSRDGWHGVTPYFDNPTVVPQGGWDAPAPVGRRFGKPTDTTATTRP